jgi:UDP-glucose 4-epimerase
MQKKKPIKIYGDGTQTRDFTYREDAVEAILLVLNNKKTTNQTYNVGSGIPTTVNQLAEHMTKIAGKPNYEIQHISPLKNDAKHKYADITKLKKLGYQPKTNLIEGLTKYLEWYKKDSKLQK